MSARIKIDLDRCLGNGLCRSEAPDLFRLNEDYIAEVLVDEITDDAVRRRAAEAARLCPTQAISIID